MAAAKGNKYAMKFTPDVLEKLGDELIDFAENNKSIHFAKFCRKYKKTRQWLLDICKLHPEFKESYQLARELMSAKISDLSFYDKESGVNATFGKENLFRYDDEWLAHQEKKAQWGKDSSEEKLSIDSVKKLLKDNPKDSIVQKD